jgi:hypothetical protein
MGLSEVTAQASYPVCTELQSKDYGISMSGIMAKGVGGEGVRCGGDVTLWGGREVTRGRRVEDTNQIQRNRDFLYLVKIFEV